MIILLKGGEGKPYYEKTVGLRLCDMKRGQMARGRISAKHIINPVIKPIKLDIKASFIDIMKGLGT